MTRVEEGGMRGRKDQREVGHGGWDDERMDERKGG